MLINALDRAECSPRKFHGGWRSKCPTHGSKGGTLKVTELPGGGVMFHCFAGCVSGDVIADLGLTWEDIYGDTTPKFDPIPRKAKIFKPYLNPVAEAVRYGANLCPSGGQDLDSWSRVYVGSCVCGGRMSAGPTGAECENHCPIREVGRLLLDLTDSQKGMIGVRVAIEVKSLNVLGSIEKKRGVGKNTGKEWVLYTIHANDDQGNPFEYELTSFNMIPVGVGEYQIEREETQFGVQYKIKNPTPTGVAISELTRVNQDHAAQIARLNQICNVPVAPAVVQAPVVPAPPAAPVVIESSEIPF